MYIRIQKVMHGTGLVGCRNYHQEECTWLLLKKYNAANKTTFVYELVSCWDKEKQAAPFQEETTVKMEY